MTQFHEGQEIEVFKIITPPAYGHWRKASIIHNLLDNKYEVEYPDGTRTAVDAELIRETTP